MPISPTGSPWTVSNWVSSRSSAWTCETSETFGSTTTSSLASGAAPTADTTSMMSACVHGVVQSLTRTPRNCPAQPGAASAAATRPRASALASGATASSRSRKTSSAGRPLDLSIIFWLLPGTDRQVRRGREGLFTLHSYPFTHGLDQQGVRGSAGTIASPGPDGRVTRPSARRRGQHQHRSPATPSPWTRCRNEFAPKDFRTDSAGRVDRAQRGDPQHQQRLDEPVRSTAGRGSGAGTDRGHQGPDQRSAITRAGRRRRGRHRLRFGADANARLDGDASLGARGATHPPKPHHARGGLAQRAGADSLRAGDARTGCGAVAASVRELAADPGG